MMYTYSTRAKVFATPAAHAYFAGEAATTFAVVLYLVSEYIVVVKQGLFDCHGYMSQYMKFM